MYVLLIWKWNKSNSRNLTIEGVFFFREINCSRVVGKVMQ